MFSNAIFMKIFLRKISNYLFIYSIFIFEFENAFKIIF